MNNLILTTLTPEQLEALVSNSVKSAFSLLQPPQAPPVADEYITENEARTLLKVSKVSLKKWRDKGTLPFYRIESRIRYKRSEIMEILDPSVRKKGKQFTLK